jgi:hypothetical protein
LTTSASGLGAGAADRARPRGLRQGVLRALLREGRGVAVLGVWLVLLQALVLHPAMAAPAATELAVVLCTHDGVAGGAGDAGDGHLHICVCAPCAAQAVPVPAAAPGRLERAVVVAVLPGAVARRPEAGPRWLRPPNRAPPEFPIG